MGLKNRGILLVSLIFAFGISLPAQTKQSTKNVVSLGIGFLSQPFSSAVGTEDWSKASSLRTKSDLELVKPLFSSRFQAATAPLAVPSPFSRPISGTISGVSGFNGLDHADSRLASNGEQFSAEPPDQALGVSRTQVLEAVNDVVALYSRSGSILAGPTALNAFFGLAPEVVNSNPPKYGPFLTDPKIQYDDRTSRWFLTVLEIAVDSATGNFKNDSKVLIAVSRNSDPRNGFNLFSIDVTDTGFMGCPCIADQPLLGINQHGIYISTNQFAFSNLQFQTALILAIDKVRLENAESPSAVAFQGMTLGGGPAFSIQPAFTPPGSANATANNGTEYLMSSLDYTGTTDNRLGVWALTNTASLHSSTPSLQLKKALVTTEVYGQPPDALQRKGSTPLRDSINANGGAEQLEKIASNDDRMQQVIFANGQLFGALNTVVSSSAGKHVGIAYFAIKPSTTVAPLTATVSLQGYIATQKESVLYPSIVVNPAGAEVIGFTLTGPDYFPSFAYIRLDGDSDDATESNIHFAARGTAPEDGFSGYQAFYGSGTARWGDYSAGVLAADGTFWIAGEYIPNRPRTTLANWGTFIAQLK